MGQTVLEGLVLASKTLSIQIQAGDRRGEGTILPVRGSRSTNSIGTTERRADQNRGRETPERPDTAELIDNSISSVAAETPSGTPRTMATK